MGEVGLVELLFIIEKKEGVPNNLPKIMVQ